jgi:hypothetical protein
MPSRVLIIIFILAALGSLYAIYTHYSWSSGEIVTISPDLKPTKIRPKEVGGVVVANVGNIVYENLQQQKGKQQVVLQPEPEKPLNLIHQPMFDDKNTDPIDEILSGIVESDYDKYKKHKGNDAKVNDAVVVPENIKTQPTQAENIQKVKNSSEQIGLNVTKVTETRNKAYKQNLSDTRSKGRYKIQLASVKSLVEAEKELERIKKKYSKILSQSNIGIKKVQYTKGKIFYIILVGEYKSISEARLICRKLSDSSQSCIISNQ